jgi:low affinity Fe/Cu permease
MSTQAQIAANQANCQLSTGPTSEAGKAASCLNNLKYGLTGNSFSVLPWENEEDYDTLLAALRASLNPPGPFEQLLVEKMAQHQWLAQRALVLQEMCFQRDVPDCDSEKKLALYLRYQTTHERAYHKYFDQLLRLRAETRKNEIGFESQKAREAAETRKQEVHEARVRLANAKAADLELDTDIRSTIEARLPGHVAIPFDRLKTILTLSLEDVARHMAAEKAAA